MAQVAPLQSHFTGGEISPRAFGRVDSDRYKSSLALCKNWLPSLQGDTLRRPGTQYVNTIGNVANPTRLLSFTYSNLQAYVLEFGWGYIRFYTNYGQVQAAAGGPYQVNTPYAQSEIFSVRIVQSADVLYLVHPAHPPMKLVRFGSNNWQLIQITFIDGPYLDVSSIASGYAATMGGTSGNQTFSANGIQAVTGASNNGSGAIRLTLADTTGITSGQTYYVAGVGGTTEANGLWQLTVIDGTHVDLQNSTFTNAYTAGGAVDPNVFCNDQPPILILGAANNGGGLVRLTVGDTSPIVNNYKYWVSGLNGVTGVNNTFYQANVIDATHVDLIGSAFAGGYVSGGLMAVATTGPNINTMVGRPIRLEASGVWNWGLLIGPTSPSQGIVQIHGTLGSVNVTSFALGVWCATTGFPGIVTFHQDRLVFGGPSRYPQRLDMSVTSDYETFSPTRPDGSVVDSDGVSFNLNANDVNQILWMLSEEKGLLIGTGAAEWLMRPATTGGAITPTNVDAQRTTRWGGTGVPPVHIGPATLHIQRGGRKLRELHYYFDIDGYRSADLSELAEHITGSGVTDMVHQTIPAPIIWILRNDGTLLGVTYDRDFTQVRVGWHQHVLGGQSDSSGTQPIVESIALIPSPDGTRDDLWMIVKRWVNGAPTRYIEYMTKIFEDIDNPSSACFLDCALTYNQPIAITNVTVANPAVVTAPSHGLASGANVRLDNILGITDSSGNSLLNTGGVRTGWFKITVIDGNTFSLKNIDTGANFSTLGSKPYVSGGLARKLVTTISGLTQLEGETVYAYADGAVQGPFVVSGGGSITLTLQAAIISVGYNYNSDVQLLRIEGGSRTGTSLGKIRRIQRAGAMAHRSQGLKVGMSFSNLDPIEFRTQDSDQNDRAPALFSGIQTFEIESDYDFDGMMCFRVDLPFPCSIQAVMPLMETQDRA